MTWLPQSLEQPAASSHGTAVALHTATFVHGLALGTRERQPSGADLHGIAQP